MDTYDHATPTDIIRNVEHLLDRGDGRYVLKYEIAYVYPEAPDTTIHKDWVLPRPGIWINPQKQMRIVGYRYKAPDSPYCEAYTVHVTSVTDGNVQTIHHSRFDSLNLTPLSLVDEGVMLEVGRAILHNESS